MGRLRGSKEEEREWRDVIKLGSKLGDREDIKRRKELVTIALACKEWYHLEKEMENKTKNQNQAVWDIGEKCIVVQLWNMGCVKRWSEKTEQFSQKPVEKSCWDPVAT